MNEDALIGYGVLYNSHKTAKVRTKMSRPVRWLHSEGFLTKTSLLDFGCGRGKDVEELRALGYKVHGYDQYYAPKMPKARFKTVIMIYVLNVLGPERNSVIHQAWNKVRDTGKLIIVARTNHDIEGPAKKQKWKKVNRGYITGIGTYQEGYTLEKLKKFANRLPKIDELITIGRAKVGGNTVIISKRRVIV